MASTVVACASCGRKNSPDRTACFQCGTDLGTLTLPLHLVPLLQPTPSGVAKLLAAWDALSTESQILILTKLKTTTRPEYLRERIRIKALESGNAYVRYLAASSLRASGDDVLKNRIDQDPDALVRYSPLEAPETAFVFGGSDKLQDADTFFAFPHEARLAIVRSMINGGVQIAQLIAHAIDHQLMKGDVSEIELFEILCDYVKKPSFREYYDSWGDQHRYEYPWSELRDIRALWNIVPKLSEAISYVLIENLPAKIARECAIPDEVPKQLDPRRVEKLLYRSDVGLEKFRKEVFWASAPHDFTRFNAAASHNFNLDFTEFSRILDLPKKDKAEILMHLSSAEDMSPFLYEAISDAFLVSDENARDYPWLGNRPPKVEARLSALQGVHEFQAREFCELRDLGLYRLASAGVRRKKEEWGYPLKGDLEFLSKHVVKGDVWGTFMAFHEACERDNKGIQWLSEYLPEWTGASENSEEALDDEGREENSLENKLDSIQEKLLSLSETLEQNEEARLSKDRDELLSEKEASSSVEHKIDFIKTKLLLYEDKFETFCKDLRYILWTVIIVFAILYGWKFVARLF